MSQAKQMKRRNKTEDKTFLKALKQKVVKTYKENFVLISNRDKRVKNLRKYERAFKKAYGVTVDVRYIEAKHVKSMCDEEYTRGYYRASSKLAIIFVDGDKYKTKRTLFHELTHAYQHQKMYSKFITSVKQMKDGEVSYEDSWHERHARHCAELIAKTNSFDYYLKKAFDYELPNY